jgi:hypothetical protein
VTGTVFEDINSNGQQDPGEPGIVPDIKFVSKERQKW